MTCSKQNQPHYPYKCMHIEMHVGEVSATTRKRGEEEKSGRGSKTRNRRTKNPTPTSAESEQSSTHSLKAEGGGREVAHLWTPSHFEMCLQRGRETKGTMKDSGEM